MFFLRFDGPIRIAFLITLFHRLEKQVELSGSLCLKLWVIIKEKAPHIQKSDKRKAEYESLQQETGIHFVC
ncbi:hypothetical protein Nepgr_029208 [Nepenthes gracilis]|uniref:Uncharacterized protein n=1 Tax=Nepenthes gracilis TaxID=150966 RepID=A0AAD3TC14_NEPGR|nr:hypothetical protein Nepgr_029208 [Nepenthes gracilis]